jgi:hypothetical protein
VGDTELGQIIKAGGDFGFIVEFCVGFHHAEVSSLLEDSGVGMNGVVADVNFVENGVGELAGGMEIRRRAEPLGIGVEEVGKTRATPIADGVGAEGIAEFLGVLVGLGKDAKAVVMAFEGLGEFQFPDAAIGNGFEFQLAAALVLPGVGVKDYMNTSGRG